MSVCPSIKLFWNRGNAKFVQTSEIKIFWGWQLKSVKNLISELHWNSRFQNSFCNCQIQRGSGPFVTLYFKPSKCTCRDRYICMVYIKSRKHCYTERTVNKKQSVAEQFWANFLYFDQMSFPTSVFWILQRILFFQ